MTSLRLEIINRLHTFVIKQVQIIQVYQTAGMNPWVPNDNFIAAFTKAAKMAYEVPNSKHIRFKFPAKTIRGPFVEFLMLTNFTFILDRKFIEALTDVPELTPYVVAEMGAANFMVSKKWGFGENRLCDHCNQKPLNDDAGNAWVSLSVCFTCWASGFAI